MAEILGLVASVSGCITFGAQLSLSIFEIASTINNAQSDIKSVGLEVSLFCSVLTQVKSALDDKRAVRFSDTALRTVFEVMARCRSCFNDIDEIIHELQFDRAQTSNQKSPRNFFKPVKWIFRRPRVQLLRGSLDSMKMTLHLMLTTLDLSERLHSQPDAAGHMAEGSEVRLLAESLVVAHEASIVELQRLEAEEEHDAISSEGLSNSRASISNARSKLNHSGPPVQNLTSLILSEAVVNPSPATLGSATSMVSTASEKSLFLTSKWTDFEMEPVVKSGQEYAGGRRQVSVAKKRMKVRPQGPTTMPRQEPGELLAQPTPDYVLTPCGADMSGISRFLTEAVQWQDSCVRCESNISASISQVQALVNTLSEAEANLSTAITKMDENRAEQKTKLYQCEQSLAYEREKRVEAEKSVQELLKDKELNAMINMELLTVENRLCHVSDDLSKCENRESDLRKLYNQVTEENLEKSLALAKEKEQSRNEVEKTRLEFDEEMNRLSKTVERIRLELVKEREQNKMAAEKIRLVEALQEQLKEQLGLERERRSYIVQGLTGERSFIDDEGTPEQCGHFYEAAVVQFESPTQLLSHCFRLDFALSSERPSESQKDILPERIGTRKLGSEWESELDRAFNLLQPCTETPFPIGLTSGALESDVL